MTATATRSGFETITCETADSIVTITMNRPQVYNALNDTLTSELQEALREVERDEGARVVILTGAGKAFCSGQDLSDLREKYVPGHVPHLGDDLRRRYNPIVRRMREMEKPLIAAVNGVAAGAGMSFALAADLRVASETASFVEVFVNVGLIPDSGSTYTLPRLVGPARAFELCCTGEKISAQDALRMGLVNRVVPPERLMEEAMGLARRLASLPARAIALTKRLIGESATNDLHQQLEAEAFAQETAGMTADHYEGVVAFMEKRTPAFKGK
jgi:2-(1,2-epoxy-1,2-dihydrophenyl)acetyl-CoA isomerase